MQSLRVSSRVLANCRRHISSSSSVRDVFNVKDEEDFKTRVMKSNIPVIVDFHAGWCAPCKALAPRIEKVVAAMGGKVHLAKVDIDDLGDLALVYGVSAVPSVIAMKDGKVHDKFVGLQEAARIQSFVDSVLEE